MSGGQSRQSRQTKDVLGIPYSVRTPYLVYSSFAPEGIESQDRCSMRQPVSPSQEHAEHHGQVSASWHPSTICFVSMPMPVPVLVLVLVIAITIPRYGIPSLQ